MFIKSSIDDRWASWLNDISVKGRNDFQVGVFPPRAFDVNEAKKNIKEGLSGILYELKNYDLYYNPNLIEKEKRSEFTVRQKEEWLLKKLYSMRKQFSSSSLIPIVSLFEGNGIELDGPEEAQQLAEELAFQGLLSQPTWYGDWCVQITTNGKKYIEEHLLASNTTERETLGDDPVGMALVLERLSAIEKKLEDAVLQGNIGNEIIFDELQDLKATLPHLTKKNWPQMLFGKIGEAILSESISQALGSDIMKEAQRDLWGRGSTLLGF